MEGRALSRPVVLPIITVNRHSLAMPSQPSQHTDASLPRLIESIALYCRHRRMAGLRRLSLNRQTGNDELLQQLRDEIGDCRRCALCEQRRSLVFGEGSPEARLVFVGEAPGADEDRQGVPFVGKAGEMLTRIIEAMQLRRSEVYIANIVKCRPPNNRDPQDEEIRTCLPFLHRQLEIINPQVICALGRVAAHALLETKTGISSLRGKFYSYRGIKVMPTYHPSYLLRSPEKKKDTWSDMQMVQRELQV